MSGTNGLPSNPCSQIAGLVNIASNYLIAGKEGTRHGTAHPSIVPYQVREFHNDPMCRTRRSPQVFPCQDGYIMVGAGNDKQVSLEQYWKVYSNTVYLVSGAHGEGIDAT